MNVRSLVLSLIISMSFTQAVVLAADPPLPTSCELTQNVNGVFTAGSARYELYGKCYIGTAYTTWSAVAVYENQRYTEGLRVGNSEGKLMGSIDSISRMPCIEDPWLTHTKCEAETKREIMEPGQSLSLWLQAHFYPRLNQYNAFSATFNYDRTLLLAKRDADLKAQARRLQQSTQKVPLITPTILAPTTNALFFNGVAVPVKIAAPQGMSVTSFNVRIESRNAQGVWTVLTTLPVTMVEATSPSGYLGWGAPGNGKGAAMIALPGTYRVSAQVAYPKPTGWSSPVEFVVTTPNKAIQKAPKMFGP